MSFHVLNEPSAGVDLFRRSRRIGQILSIWIDLFTLLIEVLGKYAHFKDIDVFLASLFAFFF